MDAFITSIQRDYQEPIYSRKVYNTIPKHMTDRLISRVLKSKNKQFNVDTEFKTRFHMLGCFIAHSIAQSVIMQSETEKEVATREDVVAATEKLYKKKR